MAPGFAAAQTGVVAGQVRDGAGREIPGAAVSVDSLGLQVTTGTDGRYRFGSIPAGRHTVRARMLGYAPMSVVAAVQAGQTTTQDFSLTTVAITLDAVTVATGETRSLAELPVAVSTVNREELARARPGHPSEVMNQMAGVWVNVTGGEGHMASIRQPMTTDPVYLYLEDGVPTARPDSSITTRCTRSICPRPRASKSSKGRAPRCMALTRSAA